ncbi:MAG: hypothetical protein KF796_19510 [Ramlibacter sp.]|nr:hypothetical protein [Ramlibacter sp.]
MQTAQLLNALSRHLGCAQGIRAKDLARELGSTGTRQIRKGISALRDEGVAICGTPSTGYYIATTPDELQQTLAFHKKRLEHEARIVRHLEALCTPALKGQLLLNQA